MEYILSIDQLAVIIMLARFECVFFELDHFIVINT